MIKILHFITDTNIGGAGKLLCNQIKNMNEDEFEVTVALPKGSELKKELSALHCSLIECEGGADKSFSPKSFYEALEILRAKRPDIVHSHASLSSRLAATVLGIPTRIHTRHCVFPLSPAMRNPVLRALSGAANNMCSTAMLAVADSAKQNLIDMGCNPEKITTIVNGVEPIRVLNDAEKAFFRAKYSISKSDFVISIFARLEEYKGHITFLEAAKICKKYYPNFRFFIIGDGSKKDELKALSHKLGIDEIVHFTGFCEDVAPYFNITDVNVNCSYGTETSSLALSEGMSLGIPCVVSDYGGNTHMVKNGVNGLIFPIKNADALAMDIIRLYRDKELYKKCSLGALRRYREEFTAQAMAKQMMEFYKREHVRGKSMKRKASRI